MSKFEKPISEQLAEQNQELGGRLEKSAKRRESLSEEKPSLTQRLSPIYWLARGLEKKWARETHESNQQDYNDLLERVRQHGAEIQVEANDYVAARKEYEATYKNLAQMAGVESAMASMDDFIQEMDAQGAEDSLARPEMGPDVPSEERERIITDWYKAHGKLFAVRDVLTPSLPVTRMPNGTIGSVVEIEGHEYRTYWPGGRIPRVDAGEDLPEALRVAQEEQVTHALELSSSIEAAGGRESDHQKKYVVLDDAMTELLRENQRFLSGTVSLYELGYIGQETLPKKAIRYGARVVPMEDLKKQDKSD